MVLLDRRWLAANWLRVVVHAGALARLGWLIWLFAAGQFIIDPVREITTYTGKSAIVLLFLSLACTPIQTVLGWKAVSKVRRALGLYAALFVALHFLTFVGLDYAFDPGLLAGAIFEQRYVIVGFFAGLILLALTITSTKGSQKRLKKNWKRLHRLVYLAGILAVVHYLWLVKDIWVPLQYAAVLAVLLVLRLPPLRRAISQARRRLQSKRQSREVAKTKATSEA